MATTKKPVKKRSVKKKPKKNILRVRILSMKTDPHQYKPYAPTFGFPEDSPVFIDVDLGKGVKMKKVKTEGTDGREIKGVLLNERGFQVLLENLMRTMLYLEPTRKS
jgi:hypothetical protein